MRQTPSLPAGCLQQRSSETGGRPPLLLTPRRLADEKRVWGRRKVKEGFGVVGTAHGVITR